MLKRFVAVCCIMILLGTLFTGCGKKAEASAVPTELIGEWICDEYASDGETYTGFYKLRVNENSEFSMYDAEAGNPGISGKITSTDSDNIENDSYNSITISCSTEDFDPPHCWEISAKTTLQYEILENGKLSLGYDDIWLTFTKED